MDTRIGFLFLITISSCIALECSSCYHIAVDYINMPENIQSLLGDMSSLDSFRRESCAANTAAKETCAVAVLGLIDTCNSFTFTMTCTGLKDPYLPDTGMKITVVTRECSASQLGTEDTCRKIDSLVDAEGQAVSIVSLQPFTEQFNSVEYNGDLCTTSTGTFPSTARATVTDGVTNTTATTRKTTTEPTSGSSTIMYMPLEVLLIAMYLM